jgi:hypothetical protein
MRREWLFSATSMPTPLMRCVNGAAGLALAVWSLAGALSHTAAMHLGWQRGRVIHQGKVRAVLGAGLALCCAALRVPCRASGRKPGGVAVTCAHCAGGDWRMQTHVFVPPHVRRIVPTFFDQIAAMSNVSVWSSECLFGLSNCVATVHGFCRQAVWAPALRLLRSERSRFLVGFQNRTFGP